MKFPFRKSENQAIMKQTQRKNTFIQEDRKHLLTATNNFFIREAYKTLRTNVMFSLTGEENAKVVAVTSSQQSEGKSITALNLAISFAQTDRKVIILDCDLRRPKLARLLQMTNTVGLSNLLMDPSLKDLAIVHSGIHNVDVVLSGDIPPNPSELLSSPRMQRLLKELKEQYDFVVLDTPPVNVVIDAVVLAPNVDGVLFVVRSDQSERGSVTHAVEQLKYANAKILGFVLNGVQLENTNYGYGKYKYGRHRRYGYGYGKYGYAKYGYTKYDTSKAKVKNDTPQQKKDEAK